MPIEGQTKQFVIFFLLVTVFLTAISIVIALINREKEGIYDVTEVYNNLNAISEQAALKIEEQETAVQEWIDEVAEELNDACYQNWRANLYPACIMAGNTPETCTDDYIFDLIDGVEDGAPTAADVELLSCSEIVALQNGGGGGG